MTTSLSLDDLRRAVPDATAELLLRVMSVAGRTKTAVYLVGGPVRDLLLSRPLVDVDLMIESETEVLAEAVARGRAGADLKVDVHDRFGTVRIESANASIDLARMRHETYSSPGALPDVVPGTLDQDLARRDFSINAMACLLRGDSPASRSPVLDPLGGLADLAANRLRVLHPRSFHDDPTRAWRAARFAVRLGCRLDRGSRAALRNAIRDGAFGAVSGERFRRELQLVFDEGRSGAHVGRILRLLSDWHVWGTLEPGLILPRDRMQPLRRLSSVIAEPDWPSGRWRPWVTGLSITLASHPAAVRRRTLERLAIRGETAKRIVAFGREADRALKALARSRGRGAVDALLSEQSEEMIQGLYARADVPVRRRILRWAAEDRRRRTPLSGDELLGMGLEGPEIGKALARIRSTYLDGELANREEAIALAEEITRRSAGRSKAKKGRRRASPKKSKSKGKKPSSTDGVAAQAAIADTSRRSHGPKRPRRKTADDSSQGSEGSSQRPKGRSQTDRPQDESPSALSPQAPRTDRTR